MDPASIISTFVEMTGSCEQPGLGGRAVSPYLGGMEDLVQKIRACRLCADRFANTATAHAPSPVVWVRPGARILIAGQAPGARVHKSGKPFTDPSGDRLRDWLGLNEDAFYNKDKVAIVPMAFCFPGYNAKGSDLPPPPVCARTWHSDLVDSLGAIRLRVIIGSYALKWHLGWAGKVDDAVKTWREHAPGTFVLPHPSWRNTGWLKRNPFFEAEVVPALRKAVKETLDG